MKNVQLTEITPYIAGGSTYLRLIYRYEDDKGVHAYIIPKASLPFSEHSLPDVKTPTFSESNYSEPPYIWCSDTMFLEEAVCELAIERGIKGRAYVFDIITEPAIHEMTLKEIEKELGYKVKIVNKENENAEN